MQRTLTNRFLVFAFFCVTLGNFLASLGLIKMSSLDKLFSLLPSNSKMLWFFQLDKKAVLLTP